MYFETQRDKQNYYAHKDNVCQAHFHRAVEILYVTKGKKTVSLDGELYELGVGDLLVCPPYRLHAYLPNENSTQIVLTFSATACPKFETLCSTQAPKTPVFHDEQALLLPFMLQSENFENELLFVGIVNYILGIYVKNTPFYPIKKKSERSFLEEIVAYIEEYYAQAITLPSIAKRFGYSPNYFSTLFKKYFYVSFTDYLNGVRVQKSLKYLKTHSVSTVYFLCGFNSPQQYFLHFKKFYGVSPKEFLKK